MLKAWTPERRENSEKPPTVPMAHVLFPNGEQRVWKRDKLERDYEVAEGAADDGSVMAAWRAELNDEATRARGQRRVGVLSGSLLSRFKELVPLLTTTHTVAGEERHNLHFQIVRLPTYSGAELLGLQVPRSARLDLPIRPSSRLGTQSKPEKEDDKHE